MNQATQQAIPSGTDVAALRQLIMGFRSSQMIYVAAKLELADRLDQCPRTAADLAADVGADPRALYRLMRALASIGIFAEGEGQTFALTPAARLLQSNVVGSLRSSALILWRRSVLACLWPDASQRTDRQAGIRSLPWRAAVSLSRDASGGCIPVSRSNERILGAGVGGNPRRVRLFRLQRRRRHRRGRGALVAALLTTCSHLRAVILDLEPAARGATQL